MKTIESIVADTINNNPIKISLRGQEINIPRPTLGTLIEVSKEISTLPGVLSEKDGDGDMQKALQRTLYIAKDCGKIPTIIAMLMLGKKDFVKEVKVCGITLARFDRLKRLAHTLEDFTAEELFGAMVEVLKNLDCGFFLGLTTSLGEINQLKPTKTT